MERRSNTIIFWGGFFLLLGAFTFYKLIRDESSVRAWQIFLVNFMYFTGIASGSVAFSALTYLTESNWQGKLREIAERMASFLPVSLLLYLLIYFGNHDIFGVFEHGEHIRREWLNFKFLFIRDIISLIVFIALSIGFLSLSKRLRGAKEGTEEFRIILGRVRMLSPVVMLAYIWLFTLLGFDLIMSLTPGWYSTLFGAFIFIHCFYLALAWIVIFSVASLGTGTSAGVTHRQYYDIGKLMLGFCLVSGDFFGSQFLVIWYGNLPEETVFIVNRIHTPHWYVLAWSVLVISFIVPFILLLSKRLKHIPGALSSVALIIAAGIWLEQFLLIVPSLWKEGSIPIGAGEILITCGFLSLFLLTCYYADRLSFFKG